MNNFRLTDKEKIVRNKKIMALFWTGNYTLAEIGNKVEISTASVSRIIDRLIKKKRTV